MKNFNFKAVGGSHFSKIDRLQKAQLVKTYDRSICLFDPHSYQFSKIGINAVENFLSIVNNQFSKTYSNHNLYDIAVECSNTVQANSVGKSSMLLATKNLPALVLKRSSRVIPGLRGTPAGITTICAPVNVASSPVS